jgi:alpha-tubulin suppressor-like RCC1 family protein
MSRGLDLQIKAKKVSVGFSHGFVLTESNEVYTWIMQAKQDDIIKKHKSFKVEGVPINTIFTDIKSGNFQTLILTDTGSVFKIDHPVPKEGFNTNILDTPLKAVQIKRLQDIVYISANCNHFLALERKDIQPLKLWGSEKVSQWVTTIGLGDCSNVIRYQKISGE